LAPQDLVTRLTPYLIKEGVLSAEPASDQLEVLLQAIPLIQERMETLHQGVGMLGFLFADQPGSPSFEVDPTEAQKVLTLDAQPVLVAARDALTAINDWTTENIEETLRVALIEGMELKPKVAFGPVRVAVTGRRVSPPLFESLQILGRERSLARITSAIN
jgi:glutamyl-tRNA synthetase